MIGALEAQDLNVVVAAVAALLTAISAFIWAMFRIIRGLSQINRAVNHQGPDEPPLVEIVKGLRHTMALHNERAIETRDRLSSLERLSTSRHTENRDTLSELKDGQEEIRKSVNRLSVRTSKLERTKPGGTPK